MGRDCKVFDSVGGGGGGEELTTDTIRDIFRDSILSPKSGMFIHVLNM